MIESYATGVAAIVLLALAWLGVQGAWRRVFPGVSADPDVLAGRTGCHGCDEDTCSDSSGGEGCARAEGRGSRLP